MFFLQELEGGEKGNDVRNRHITPRTWNLLHRRRGKLSFSRKSNQNGGDAAYVNNKTAGWSDKSSRDPADASHWPFRRSRAHTDDEKRIIQSGVGCASVLKETKSTNNISSQPRSEATRRVSCRENRPSSVHCDQITSQLLSRSQPSLHSSLVIGKIVRPINNADNIVDSNRVGTTNKARSITRVNSHHVTTSDVGCDVVEVRRRRWRDTILPVNCEGSEIVSARDVEYKLGSVPDLDSAGKRCDRQTDQSIPVCVGNSQPRIHVRPHSVHMVNLSGTSSVTGLSSDVDTSSPASEECQCQHTSSLTGSGKTTDAKMDAHRKLTPSPKYRRAPDPPGGLSVPVSQCKNSSVSVKMASKMAPKPNQVLAADVSSPDHEGWAVDQLHGKRVWCVLTDMLFCTFESKEAAESREVIILPGCKVRSLVFKSAKRESLAENHVEADNDRKKTISGVDRYQFLIDNVTSRRKYLFGIETKAALDKWVNLLTKACSVDVTITSSENLNHSEAPPPRDQVDSCVGPYMSTYLPTNHRCRRMDIMSMSLEDDKLSDSQKHDTLVDFKRRLRGDSDTDVKSHPLKATHASDSVKTATIKPKSKSFLKLKSFGSLDSLLRRHKRSKKSDADVRKQDFEVDSQGGGNARLRSESMHVHSEANQTQRSWSLSKSSEILTPKSRRHASDLKDKIFSAKCSPRSIGLRLDDLTDIRISGTLLYKFMERWIKVWCVVSRGCLYGFRSQDSEQSPIVAIVLTRCSVTYVTDPGKRSNQMYVFRLSQPHCKSIYLCAQEEGELSRWLQVLQMEANHVLADESINLDTSELNYSVDSAFSTMSLSSSHTDLTDTGQSSSLRQTIADEVPGDNSDELPADQADKSSSGTDNSNESTQEDWDNSSNTSSQVGAPVFEMGVDAAPRHDPNLTRVWQKDKGYLFQVIRAKLRQKKRNSSSGGKPIEAPGAETGGLLVIHDDDDAEGSKDDDVVFEKQTNVSIFF